MKIKTIQVTDVTFDELADKVAEKLLFKIERYIIQNREKKDDELLTRIEASEYLKVSLTTIHHWTKRGILKPYRIGNRIYYKKHDINESFIV